MLQITKPSAITIQDLFPDFYQTISNQIPNLVSPNCINQDLTLSLNLVLITTTVVGIYCTCKASRTITDGYFFGSLFYTGMTISALAQSLLHQHNLKQLELNQSLLQQNKQDGKHSISWELLRILIIVFAGSCALSFWYTRLIVPKRMYVGTFALLLGYNLRYSFLTTKVVFLTEFTAIGSILVALVAITRKMNVIGTSREWKLVSWIGLTIMMTSILIDGLFCIVFIPHCMFIGSSLIILGLVELSSTRTRLRKKD